MTITQKPRTARGWLITMVLMRVLRVVQSIEEKPLVQREGDFGMKEP